MIKKTQDIAKNIKTEKVGQLPLNNPVFVSKDTALFAVLEKMRVAKSGCALIREENRLIGIFTERDVLSRVIEAKLPLDTPIEKVITVNPETLPIDSTIEDAIRVMDKGGYRHIPIMETKVDGDSEVTKILSVRDLIKYFGSYFADEVYNLPPDPHQVQREREGA